MIESENIRRGEFSGTTQILKTTRLKIVETERRAFDNELAENPAPTRVLTLGVEAERQYNRLVKIGVPPSLAAKLLG